MKTISRIASIQLFVEFDDDELVGCNITVETNGRQTLLGLSTAVDAAAAAERVLEERVRARMHTEVTAAVTETGAKPSAGHCAVDEYADSIGVARGIRR